MYQQAELIDPARLVSSRISQTPADFCRSRTGAVDLHFLANPYACKLSRSKSSKIIQCRLGLFVTIPTPNHLFPQPYPPLKLPEVPLLENDLVFARAVGYPNKMYDPIDFSYELENVEMAGWLGIHCLGSILWTRLGASGRGRCERGL